MQRVNCFVRLGGDMLNTVPKQGVTVAEIAILQHLHGADAVVEIQPTTNKQDIAHAAEIERLRDTYGLKAFAEVFPGRITNLPIYLKDIEIDKDSPFLVSNARKAVAGEDEPKKKRGRPRKEAEKAEPKETAAKDFEPTIEPEPEQSAA